MPKLSLTALRHGFDGNTCYVHARAGAFPDGGACLTLQKLMLSGIDTFSPAEVMLFDGEKWTAPCADPAFTPWQDGDMIRLACDLAPDFHRTSGKLIAVGHTVCYRGTKTRAPATNVARRAAYAVFDRESGVFHSWKTLDLPDLPEFYSSGSGCTQWVEEEDGTILLPHYCSVNAGTHASSVVVRCAFDGETLTYLEHGPLITGEVQDRGLYEPSLIRFGGRYFLTLRADRTGFVTESKDGLRFGEPREWCFDNGEPIGNYNTQQHFFTLGGKLYLVYTRRGLNNDHVFRHRAPLVCAEVDTGRLCLRRDTEQILVPERGARLGNFGITKVGEHEVWVTAAEWMQPIGCEKYGSDNTVWLARLPD